MFVAAPAAVMAGNGKGNGKNADKVLRVPLQPVIQTKGKAGYWFEPKVICLRRGLCHRIDSETRKVLNLIGAVADILN